MSGLIHAYAYRILFSKLSVANSTISKGFLLADGALSRLSLWCLAAVIVSERIWQRCILRNKNFGEVVPKLFVEFTLKGLSRSFRFFAPLSLGNPILDNCPQNSEK